MTLKAVNSRNDIAAQGAIDSVLARYAKIAGDESAFAKSLSKPLPPCVWCHPLRLTRERLAKLLAEDNIGSEPISWTDTALRLASDSRPGLSWVYKAGLMQIQEEAAMLPVHLLDPKPDERILDLCAAPGNKTAQIALALRNRGTVVANDRNEGRLAPLHATISRLGLMNVTTTAHNGITYPAENSSFDKVLVDVPCSGEGTVRRGAGKHKPVTGAFRRWVNGVQYALLNRATDLCRPGGRIVYSTCTLSPDENEAIVDRILTDRPGELRILDTVIPNLAISSGVLHWGNRSFGQAVSRSIRLWPHVSDTSGFYAVLLERLGDKPKNDDHAVARGRPGSLNPNIARFIDQFGLSDTTIEQCSVIGGRSQRRLVAGDHCPPEQPSAIATGLAFTRDKAKIPKLSTQAALALGDAATRNFIELERDEIKPYMDRDSFPVPASRLAACEGPGYIIVRHQGFALGLAGLKRQNESWICESLFPKERG